MRSSLIAVFALACALAQAQGAVVRVDPARFEASLNEAIDLVQGPTVIELPAGLFSMTNEVLIDRPGVTLRGQGAAKTILSFKNQKAGSQGIFASKDQVTFEDFTVEDTFGNAIKTIGVNHSTFRRLRVRWTRGPSVKNGAYGLYPVMGRNVLVEDCEVSGASDAGVYVGQSEKIVVRRNNVHGNVAGVEIENSDDAEVVDNHVHHNTAGVLVFNLPDLVKKLGQRTRVHDNLIEFNNLKNFSTKGSIIHLAPKGLGMLLLAAHQVEIYRNDFRGHKLAGITIANYAISQRPIRDPSYDPMPKGITIYGNRMRNTGMTFFDGTQMNFIIKILGGLTPKDVVYDGINDGTYNGPVPSEDERLCLGVDADGQLPTFANLHLDHQRRHLPIPGGPVDRNARAYACERASLGPVALEDAEVLPMPAPRPTAEQTLQACTKEGEGVNWGAVEFDCPELSQLRLFRDASDPTRNPTSGFRYELVNQLFTDYALKDRFVFLPPGTSAAYRPKYELDFPVGTIITKSFSIQEASRPAPTLIETRLLVRRAQGWVPLNYVWKDGVAKLSRGGEIRPMVTRVAKLRNVAINYQIPNLRQCASCHYINDEIRPIGPTASHLNRAAPEAPAQNQLRAWEARGALSGLPDLTQVAQEADWKDPSAPIDARARGYLAINCAHCHNPVGNARPTGLFLGPQWETGTIESGVCKTPVAAGLAAGGRSYDIMPGSAAGSILYYRMGQEHLAVKMPQLGRSIPHEEGNALIRDWIDGMAPQRCK